MEIMRAWMVKKPGLLTLEEVQRPTPVGDEVLVKIDGMCICNGSDPEIYHGHEAYTLPMIFGHEASGHIVEKGPLAEGFEVGQRVCWWCQMGAFAQYQSVSTRGTAMFVAPNNVTREQAPVMELIIAASRALMPFTDCAKGKSLLLMGLGPSGLTAVQYAKALGFSEVYGWDLYPQRRERALGVGADGVYDPSDLAFDQQVAAMPEVDLAIDMMGDELLEQSTFTKMLRKVRSFGTVVSYGHPEHGRTFSPYVFQSRNLTMVSPENDLDVIRQKGAQLMQFVADGRVQVQPLITDVRPFEALGPSFEALLKDPGSEIKLIFTV